MVLLLSLDKTEYYKEEYSDKIFLNGIITGMDLNKQYCIKYSCLGINILNDVHNNTYDYTFLTNRTSSNLSAYGAYIPLSELSFDSNGIADIIVQVNVVNDNCSNIDWTELDSFVNIIVYNYNKPITTKNTELSIFVSKSEAISDESIFIEGYLKTEDGYPIYNAKIDFYDKDALIDQKLKENDSDIYTYTAPDGYYVGFWPAQIMDILDKTIEIYTKFEGDSNFNKSESEIKTLTIIEPEPEEPILTAEIGTITYEIHEQIGEDEITFTIPIKNTSEDTIYNYIKLFDVTGNEIEQEPDLLPKKISTTETENIILSSKYKSWSIEDIQGQEVTFKLYSDFSSFTKLENYIEIDSKSFDVEKYSEDKITPKLTIILSTTTAATGDEIRISGMLTTKEGIPLQFGRVWIYATGGITKNFLMDESDIVLYADTDNNGIYQIYWHAKQMDKDETIELIAMTESDDDYNAVQSLPIILTLADIEEKLEEQEECFIDNPFYPLKSDNPCLISDTQATWIKYGAIGIAGLYVFSTVAPIIKGTGKFIEKKYQK